MQKVTFVLDQRCGQHEYLLLWRVKRCVQAGQVLTA